LVRDCPTPPSACLRSARNQPACVEIAGDVLSCGCACTAQPAAPTPRAGLKRRRSTADLAVTHSESPPSAAALGAGAPSSRAGGAGQAAASVEEAPAVPAAGRRSRGGAGAGGVGRGGDPPAAPAIPVSGGTGVGQSTAATSSRRAAAGAAAAADNTAGAPSVAALAAVNDAREAGGDDSFGVSAAGVSAGSVSTAPAQPPEAGGKRRPAAAAGPPTGKRPKGRPPGSVTLKSSLRAQSVHAASDAGTSLFEVAAGAAVVRARSNVHARGGPRGMRACGGGGGPCDRQGVARLLCCCEAGPRRCLPACPHTLTPPPPPPLLPGPPVLPHMPPVPVRGGLHQRGRNADAVGGKGVRRGNAGCGGGTCSGAACRRRLAAGHTGCSCRTGNTGLTGCAGRAGGGSSTAPSTAPPPAPSTAPTPAPSSAATGSAVGVDASIGSTRSSGAAGSIGGGRIAGDGDAVLTVGGGRRRGGAATGRRGRGGVEGLARGRDCPFPPPPAPPQLAPPHATHTERREHHGTHIVMCGTVQLQVQFQQTPPTTTTRTPPCLSEDVTCIAH
jgi:hypothetical protein